MDIRIDDLRDPQVIQLLRDHLAGMRRVTPPGSVHALDLDALRQPDITFWTAWQDAALLGCGALKTLAADEGEIKSMRTAAAHLRMGVAAALLTHIIDEATRRSYARLYLETGASPAFAPAHHLYRRFGFRSCGPFTGYVDDPNSVFMTKQLG